MTPTTIADNDSIDTTRDVWQWLHMHGLPADKLVDPSDITPEHFGENSLDRVRVVSWDSGPSEHPVGGDDIVEEIHHDPATAGVAFGSRNAEQPIDFDGALNNRPSSDVTVFAFGERDYPELTRDDVFHALERIRHYTPLRRETVTAWSDVFGVDNLISHWESDEHGDWTRAEFLPMKIVSSVDGLETKSADSGISGKKKIARQRYNRNLDQLSTVDGVTVDE